MPKCSAGKDRTPLLAFAVDINTFGLTSKMETCLTARFPPARLSVIVHSDQHASRKTNTQRKTRTSSRINVLFFLRRRIRGADVVDAFVC